ncbi:MAG: hypothetical protein R3E79_42965 [Caldilineaceae bacterium]
MRLSISPKPKPLVPLNLLVTWDGKRNQLLPLVTDFDLPDEVLAWYPKRFWAEPLYGDCKGHGFDLQSSRQPSPTPCPTDARRCPGLSLDALPGSLDFHHRQ